MQIALCIALVLSALAQPQPYRLGPGDVISITVRDHPELSTQVTIPPDGAISYPLAGRIKVAGLTIAEVQQQIVKALSRELRNPDVSVNLVSAAKRTVRVGGEVAEPAEIDLLALGRSSISLSAAIGLAGGCTSAADPSYVVIIRAGQPPKRLDLPNPPKGPVPAGYVPDCPDVQLRPGDAVIVPGAERTVSVVGEVNSPGRFPLLRGSTLLSVIAQAGDCTENADLSRVLLIRRSGKQISVDLSGLRTGSLNGSSLPPLQDGDTVVVLPKQHRDVVVLGEVSQPGRVPIHKPTPLAKILAAVGGPTDRADLSRVEIIQPDGSCKRVNLADETGELAAASEAAQITLAGGETVRVPRIRRMVSVLGFVRQPGVITFRPGARIADVISQAGGPEPRYASPSKTILIRPGPDPNNPQVVEIDLDKVLRGEAPDQNVQVRHGDIIYVPGNAFRQPPGRRGQEIWRTLLQVGGLLGLLLR